VVQLLSDLEFSVEPCNEPFAAVKKLMAQHFDALVVDCENEQNATLLFKGARNSGSNQGSLMVAIVEGQTGVAKAFRIGANLVLTKPINIEQSKGTLRVARGLLRKGEAAKPAAPATESSRAVAPVPAALTSAPAQSEIPAPAASSSAFELEAEPAPEPGEAEAALLEYMPASVPAQGSATPPAAASSNLKQYPWQPVAKSPGEPMASALRRAAEAAGEAGSAFTSANSSTAPQVNAGAAAAPALAKQPSVVSVADASSIAAGAAPSPKKIEEKPEPAHAWTEEPSLATTEPPKFAALGAEQESSQSGGSSRKFLLAAIVVLAGAAGYLGWNRMHPERQPARTQLAPVQTAVPTAPQIQTEPPAPPSAEVTPDSVPTIAVDPSQVEITRTPIAQSEQSSSESSTKTTATKPAAGITAASASKTPVEGKAPAEAKAEEPIEVKAEITPKPNSKPAVEEPEPAPAPATIAMDSGAESKTLSGIVSASSPALPASAPKTIKISQGVSQGLIIKRVQPEYPAMAREMRLQGTVQLDATIGKDGSVQRLKQLSGDQTLGAAALTAVRQWKYKPYILDGEPVEVQTEITVNFKLP